MRFARRTDWDQSEGAFARAVSAARRRGGPLLDLTESNPTRAGLFDAAPLVALLGHPRGAAYAPDALGHPIAREAVASYYAERALPPALRPSPQALASRPPPPASSPSASISPATSPLLSDVHPSAPVDPSRIALTASTSEAYGYLFKLLCERGDRVLVPAPSYPLFEYLAACEDVVIGSYPLVRQERWRIDLGALERSIDDRTRAILLVHPNNPTGSLARADEAAHLEALANDRGLALIVDEVFGDYPLGDLPPDRLPTFAGRDAALTFVLSGLSKALALPQLKLAWIAASGPEAIVRDAMARLEVIADTYLSVATPVQLALPELLAARDPVQRALRDRTRANLHALDDQIAALGPDAAIRRLPVDAGWYAILELPRIHGDDAWVELLLNRAHVIVHPGYFFDFSEEGFLVLSLLPEPDAFREGVARALAILQAECR